MSSRSRPKPSKSTGSAVQVRGKPPVPASSSRVLRRALHRVDTNLNSYDRTDPFTALNTLLKLFSSLATRIGGCQFKLTPEEHKLSMHLLSIVEPFVGLSQERRSLTRQPTELLDAIVLQIDSKRDLLSLALSCKHMHSIVFPRHYDYRVIKAKVSSLRLWNYLIVNRSLARNVRVLEILDERDTGPELLPTDILGTDTDLESTDDELGLHAKQERFLSSALSRMTMLQAFMWSCNHSPISIDNVWPSLLKCHSLGQIVINDNLIFNGGSDDNADVPTTKKRQIVLPHLRSAAFTSTKHLYGSTRHPSLNRVSNMLNNCPNLEDLAVGYTQRRGNDYNSPIADDLLLCGRWPHLRSLTLTNLWCSPHTGFDVTATFLSSHAYIQVLHIDLSTSSGPNAAQLVLPVDSLPRLRELKSSREFANAVLQCPCTAENGRPLEIIKGVRLTGLGSDDRFLHNLKVYGSSSVRRLELLGWHDMEDLKRLAECAPKLNWLDLGKRFIGPNGNAIVNACAEGPSSSRLAPVPHANVAEWATLLSSLGDLTTFHGVKLFYEVTAADPNGSISASERSRQRKNEEIASVLAWKCPKLRRLDHWEENPGKVIVLIRDGEKVRYETRRVKA
ncbi:hypothetical protein BDY19DRAFT_1041748 [Irpex rosettiformis]|uniref:Uncharacterized protein n=1 Tax=Irpex rosettiformis TaxID=378272 RepID=A0ACB8U3W0_9APHY|nr:hypothetical protein BDY19DRAFT_1041748 [Irpex rosettiformis]